MARRHYRGAFVILAAAAMFGTASVRGAIVDGSNGTGTANTTGPFPVAGLSNVGVVNFDPASSGVYIGNNWVLTASHIAPPQNFPGATFTVAGGTYTVDSYYQFTNSDSSSADLVALHLTSTPALPSLTLSTSSPSSGTDIYAMGNGQSRTAGPMTITGTQGTQYYGYDTGSPNVLRYGTSITSATPTVSGETISNNGTTEVINVGYGPTTIFTSTFEASTVTGFNTSSMVLSGGDSGGAVFGTNNVLLGINDLLFTGDDQPANTAVYGDDSGFVNVATYESEIAAVTGVPEPATACLIACASLLLLSRRATHPNRE